MKPNYLTWSKRCWVELAMVIQRAEGGRNPLWEREVCSQMPVDPFMSEGVVFKDLELGSVWDFPYRNIKTAWGSSQIPLWINAAGKSNGPFLSHTSILAHGAAVAIMTLQLTNKEIHYFSTTGPKMSNTEAWQVWFLWRLTSWLITATRSLCPFAEGKSVLSWGEVSLL